MEEFRDIVGYEGLYQVSNIGNVKSVERMSLNPRRNLMLPIKEKILKKSDVRGYKRTMLYKDSISRVFSIHRLVALMFIPNPENKPQVNHINGIKDDNRVDNLEWCTNSENIRHSYKNGLQVSLKGERMYNSKITEEQALIIINAKKASNGKAKWGLKELAKELGVHYGTAIVLSRGASWKYLQPKK